MSIKDTEAQIEKRKKEQAEEIDMIAEVKKRIIIQIEQDNPEKTAELVSLWQKKKEELANNQEDKATTIGYKVGSTISNMVSGFKKGLNKS